MVLIMRRPNSGSSEIKAKVKLSTVASNSHTVDKNPVPVRLSPHNKAEMNLWCTRLSEIRGKKVSAAKLFRGLIALSGKVDDKELLDAIS
jgi:hypothetical protein